MSKELLSNRVAEIKSAVEDKVSATYLARAEQAGVETNSLPASGTFGTFKTAGSIVEATAETKASDFRHLRMTVVGTDDTISLGNLKLIAPTVGEPLEFGDITKVGALKGKKFLRGKAINPKFSQYSTLELIAYLEGKKFEATQKDCIQLKFNPTGYEKVDPKKDIRTVTAYQVTIID